MSSRRPIPAAAPFPTDRLPRLLLLGGLLGLATPAGAATISVPCDTTQLIAAINTANANGEADTLNLAAGCAYTFTTPDNYWYGPNALPAISSTITIEGNGAIIERDAGAATPFRLFYISGGLTNGLAAGSLTLKNLTLRNGYAKGGNANAGGGGLGAGGAIFNQGALTLDGATLTANTAAGGSTASGSSRGGGGIGQDAPAGQNGGGFGGPFPCGVSPCGGVGGNGDSSGAGGGGGGFQANGSAAAGTTGGAGGGSSRLGGDAAAGTASAG
ncbi:MAG: hypothetical protein P9G45_08235, partial [Candidatus Contendobacter sp.]|nr:hypothetical protein [Candidatus Contendobacter sp.]